MALSNVPRNFGGNLRLDASLGRGFVRPLPEACRTELGKWQAEHQVTTVGRRALPGQSMRAIAIAAIVVVAFAVHHKGHAVTINRLSSLSNARLATAEAPQQQSTEAKQRTSVRGKMTGAAPGILSLNESYGRPVSPIGTTARAATRYLSVAAVQGAIDKLPAYTSAVAMSDRAAEHLVAELAKCDPSKPTTILLLDLHGTAGDLAVAATTLAASQRVSRPKMLVEQPTSLHSAFDVVYSLSERLRTQLRTGASSPSTMKEVMDKHGVSESKAVNICTWAIAYTLRGEVEPFDLNKGRPDATMEVREEAMKRVLNDNSKLPGSCTIAQAGIFHFRALHEELANRSDHPNVLALAVVPENLSFLQPDFTEQDIRRLSYLMATDSVLKLKQADSMVNDFPDCVALMKRHSPA